MIEKNHKKILLDNIDNIHTTPMGFNRIIKNLKLIDENPIDFCLDIIKNNKCLIIKNGKNYYCTLDNYIITINSFSYTIITAHLSK